jgi:hypothetical protein
VAIAFVQSKLALNASTVTTISAVFTTGPIQGNLIVGCVMVPAAVGAFTTTGFTQGTAQSLGSGGTTRAGVMFWKVAGAGESSTVTATWTGTTTPLLIIGEYSGVDQTTPLLAQTSVANASGTTITGAATPGTGKVAVAVCALQVRTVSTSWSAEAISGTNVGAVTEREDNTVGNEGCALFDGFISATDTGTYQGSGTPSAAGVGLGFIAVFQAAVVAGFVRSRPILKQQAAQRAASR